MVVHLEGRQSSFWPYTAMFNFSYTNGTGLAAGPLTTEVLYKINNGSIYSPVTKPKNMTGIVENYGIINHTIPNFSKI